MVRFLVGGHGRPAPWLAAALVLLCAGGAAATTGDPAKGRAVFASQCSVCHSNARGGPVILGPPLFGVVGRKAGSLAGFSYSSAMRAAGFAWTPEHLRAYLPAPRAYLPGVRMTYPGLKNPDQLEDLIAYLDTLE
jgi:cytochrome c